MRKFESVDAYITAAEFWQNELVHLRAILTATKLEETVKWSLPCYTYEGKNVVGMGAFKSYIGLWFFQGVFLEDKQNLLINAQEGKTKALRQWRFQSIKEIKARLITAYVNEAITLCVEGAEIKPNRSRPIEIPDHLLTALSKNPTADLAFRSLSKGQQREYANHIADAKRDETKAKRIKKILPMIISGQGLNDKYRRG